MFNRAYPEISFSMAVEGEQETFDPDTIAVLAVAVEGARRELRLIDCNDPAITEIAKTIIRLALQGERDPIRLRDLAIEYFRAGPIIVEARAEPERSDDER